MQPASAILIPHEGLERPDSTRLAGAFIARYSSVETRRAYGSDLRQWFEFCRRYQLDPMAVRSTEVNVYMRELEDRGLANNTRGRRLSCLKSFYGWCFDEQLLDGNPAARVDQPAKDHPEMPALDKDGAHRFAKAAEEDDDPYCAAALHLLLLAGLRVTEATSRNIRDLKADRWMGRLEVRGKGDKVRTIELPARALAALDRARAGRNIGALLLNQAGRRVNRTNIRRQVHRVAERADVRDDLSPHCLRRSFIQIALDDGVPIRDVQLYVGHSTPSTTTLYDRRGLAPGKAPSHRVAMAVA